MQEMSWYQFLYNKRKLLVMIVCAILLGMLYSGYQIKCGHVSQTMVASYMGVDAISEPLSRQTWQTYFWQSVSYLKKIGLIWLCGLSGYLIPIGIALALVYIFSYSYTCMTMLTVLEMNSYGMRIVYVLICSVIMTSYLAFLIECLLKRRKNGGRAYDSCYIFWLLGGIVISAFLTCITMCLW